MRINNNLMAMNTHRQLGINSNNGAKSIEKLSSGYRINRAGDDAAGLAISEKMRGQIRGLNQASRNSQDAISLVQTAEGALNESQAILQRMRELAVQSANDTNESEDRDAIQNEIDQLTSELNRISETTEFNKKKLLDGSLSAEAPEKQIDADAPNAPTYSDVTISNVAIDGDTTLANADYEINITNTTVNSVADGQISGVTDASVSGADNDLSEGSYKVEILADTVTSVTSQTDDVGNPVLDTAGGNTAVTLSADSNLDIAKDYDIDVTKTTTKTATGSNASGISNVDVSAFDDGTRFDVAVEATIDAAAIDDAATGTLWKEDGTSGAISNITITSNSTLSEADNYKIKVDQLGDTQALQTADLTGQTAVDLSNDVLNIDVGGGPQGVALTNVNALGAGYDAVTNINAVATALQNDIDAVFDGTANGGVTFTVAVSGNQLEITSNQEEIGADFEFTGANDLNLTGTSTAVTNSTDDVKLRFSLTNDTGSGDTVVQSAEATFTNTAGATNIALGDISFDVSNTMVYASDANRTDATAGSYNALTLDLSADGIKNKVTVTKDGDAGTAVSKNYAQGAGLAADEAFTFGADDLELDITSTDLAPGQTQTTIVDVSDSYSIQLTETVAGTNVGDAVVLADSDLVDPNNLKNIAIGAAGNGVFVDLDASKLQDIDASGGATTASVTLELDEVGTFTAELQNADGSAVAGTTKWVLDNTAGDHTQDLGKGIVIDYDGAPDLGAGDIFFSTETTADNFQAALKVSGAGVDLEVVSFEAGETIEFTENNITLDTTDAVADGEQATFTIEDGTGDLSVKMQIGANTAQSISIGIDDMGASSLGISSDAAGGTVDVFGDGSAIASFRTGDETVEADGSVSEYSLDIGDHDKATAAIEVINNALTSISDQRAQLGAIQNRLEHTIKNLDTSAENLQASESRIRDVDMAKEMMEFTKNNILQQAAQSMLAQANQAPQGVLQLLR